MPTFAQQKKQNTQPPKPVSATLARPHQVAAPAQPALAGSGRPLESALRRDMEQRFSHDFSQVRVHTDTGAQSQAAAQGALAYTAGHDLVFGAGQYQPQTMAGRWMIGHELAHVIQQQGTTPTSGSGSGSGAAESALEREAGEAGMRVALGGRAQVSAAPGGPAMQFLRVSSGGFGKALEEYTNAGSVPDSAVRLLTKSATFMNLVSTLDKHYIWLMDPSFDVNIGSKKLPDWHRTLDIGPDGRVLKPPSAAGKRALSVMAGGSGASFQAFGAPGNDIGADVIAMAYSAADTPGFIQTLAHEATHAAAFVGAPAPKPQTLATEIQAGIQDEIGARASEAKILGEIPDPKVKANIKLVGSREPWQVERDVSPAFNLTYLELFFFGRELADAQAAEKLNPTQAAHLRKEIDNYFGSVLLKPSPGYGQIWFQRATAVHEWEEFHKTHSPGDSNYEAEKEKLLQAHAKRFFQGKVSYRPVPTPSP